jgi:hypothetical protein
MLSKLEYLTREEFTYLYPTCMNNNDVLKTTADILSARGKISVDNLLIKKMMSMDNYQEAYNLLMTSDVIDESVMEQIGMNRKSVSEKDLNEVIINMLLNEMNIMMDVNINLWYRYDTSL